MMRSLFVVALAAASPMAAAEPLAITGAKVHTDAKTVVEDATVVVDGGVIQSIRAGGPVPTGARVIDGRGMIVTPGLIDASTALGLVEVDQVSEANDGSFAASADKIHAAYRVTDGFNDASVGIPVARLGGVTSVIVHPSGSLISGQAAFVRLSPRHGPSSIIRAPVAMIARLGSTAMGPQMPSRGSVIERLREVLEDARQYRRSRAAYDRNQTRRMAAERLDLEALEPVVTGRLPLVIRAHRASDIRAAIAIGKDFGVRVIIEGGTEAWVVADELARAQIGVLIDPLSNLPYDFDRVRVRSDNAARLKAAGVDIAITSIGEWSNVRRLRQLAGNAVAHGLSWSDALDAVTAAPARLFGVKDLGTLAAGKPADLVLWTGDPFELSTRPHSILIGGELVPLESRQTKLRDRYRRLRQGTRMDPHKF